MPLTTPQSLILFALKSAGIQGVGQTPLPEDINDSFSVLNGMIGQWNRRRWVIFHLLDLHVTTTGAMSYTVGPGCDFDVARVDRLEAAFFRQYVSGVPGQTYVDYPLDILQSREDYNQIALKQLTSWPQAVFFDSGTPFGTVYPVPIPLQNGTYELHLTVKEHLPQFTSLVQYINLPEEYTEALWTNLTVRLCAIYGAALNPIVAALAKASLSTIEVANTQIPRLRMPRTMIRPPLYNIFSGQTY